MRTATRSSFRTIGVAVALSVAGTPLPAWEFHRTLTPAVAGANIIRPDAELLAHTQPWYPPSPDGNDWKGIEDLRIFDGARKEVPYLLLVPTSRQKWNDGVILATLPTKTASGFEVDLGASAPVETLRVEGLSRSFMKRYRLEGSGDREHWTVLVEAGTLFDLPEQSLTDREMHFQAGEYRYLRVTWDDRTSARVSSPSRASARRAEPATSVPSLMKATLQRIESEPRRSRYIVHFPSGRLPAAALTIQSSTPDVLRSATVFETRLEGSQMSPVILGRASLRKASRGELSASSLRVPIDRPEGSDLELEIDDGDNPPLAIDALFVELLPLPVVYFQAASTQPLDVEYGDPEARRPQYDLEANRQYLASVPGQAARWGTEQSVAPQSVAPRLSFAGAVLDPAAFRFHRAIREVPPGLVTLALDAAVLAETRAGLPDLRLIDTTNHQVPYLLERRAAPLQVPLAAPARLPPGERPSVSRYRIHLPYSNLRGVTLVVETDSMIFDRSVTVERQNGDRAQSLGLAPLASVRWTHTDSHVRPPSLQVSLEDPGAADLILSIDEGDNAPLALKKARLFLPAWRLRFYHPGGALRLLYGNSDTASPRYDLALLAPQIIGKPAREVAFVTPNSQPVEGGEDKRPLVFWAVIGLAVAALLLILTRLLREGGGVAPAPPGE